MKKKTPWKPPPPMTRWTTMLFFRRAREENPDHGAHANKDTTESGADLNG